MAVTSKHFGGADLDDLCIEGTLVGPISIDSAIKGKLYNRTISAKKIVYV